MISRKILLTSVVSLALGISAESEAESMSEKIITVGILDIEGTRSLSDDRNLEIIYHSFVGNNDSEKSVKIPTHGDMMIFSIIDQTRKMSPNVKLKIFSAGVIEVEPGKDGIGKSLKFNYKAFDSALDWFKENNVKVVTAAFVSTDSIRLRSMVEKAKENGIVLIAPTPNVSTTKQIYPAAYKGVISVTGVAPELPITSGEMTWGDIAINGDVVFSWSGAQKREFGSSYAAGRIASILGMKHCLSGDISYESSIEFFNKVTRLAPVAMTKGGASKPHSVSMSILDEKKFNKKVDELLNPSYFLGSLQKGKIER